MANRYWVGGGTGNWNSTTNWSATSGGASGASVPTNLDDVFLNSNSGSGNVILNTGGNTRNLDLTGFIGTINFINSLTVNGTALNFGSGGYTITGASFLRLGQSMTITSSAIAYAGNIDFVLTATYTLANNMTVSGTVVFSASGTMTVNGNTLNILSNLSHQSNGLVVGTTSFVLGGTGTWNYTASGSIRNNLTINTAGTITLGTNIYYNTGTLTYTAGTVVTAGSTLNINLTGSNTTLNTNGIIWNNINTTNSITLTLGSNLTLTGTLTVTTLLNFVLGGNSLISINANLFVNNGTFNLPANQTFKSLSTANLTAVINNNTLTLTQNITLGAPTTGTSNILYGGTGTWTAGTAAHIINNNFTINTAGTLTISGTVYKGLNTFTYTAGTIVDTGATVVVGSTAGGTTCNVAGKTWEKLLISGGVITLTSNINAVTFGTTANTVISFTLGGNTLNFTHLELGSINTTTLPSAWVCQNINFTLTGSGAVNGFSITINGNIVQSGNGLLSGTTTFTYGGTGTWSRTGTTYFNNSFTINTAGTLTFSGGSIGGGIFTYTAGTVNVQIGSILYIRQASTTMNHGNIVWYDVILGTELGAGSIASLVLNNKLTCSNSLILGLSNTVFSGTDGTFDTYDLYFGSPLNSSQTTRLVATKTYTVRRLVQCTQAPSTFPLTLNSTVVGTKAIFTVLQSSTINIGFLNATDINSSLGKKIYSYRGVFSNTDNWEILPTDPIFSSSSTFII